MTGALTPLILAAGIGVGVIAIQQAALARKLRKQLDLAATSPFSRSAALLDPLKDAPVPAFRTNDRGQILWHNVSFARLFGNKPVPELLEEASHILGAPLLLQIYKGGFLKQIKITKSDMREHVYGVMRWENQNGRTLEVSCILLPQNQHSKQQQQQHRFEHDIIRLLKEALVRGTTDSKDLQEVLETLEVLQPHVRRQQKLQHVDIVPLVQQMAGSSSPLRRAGNSVTFTSPRSITVHGESSDLALALSLLAEGIYELQPAGRIAVKVATKEKYIQVDVQIPDMLLAQQDIRDITLLSGESQLSIHARLRFALVEQILIKHHGNLTTASERGLGTIFELQFRLVEE